MQPIAQLKKKLAIPDVVVAQVISSKWHERRERERAPPSDRSQYFQFLSKIRRIANDLLNGVHEVGMDSLFANFALQGGSLNQIQFISAFLQLFVNGSCKISCSNGSEETTVSEIVCALLELFARADIDGDGTISVEELLVVILGFRSTATQNKFDRDLQYKKRPPFVISRCNGQDKIATAISADTIAVKEVGSKIVRLLKIKARYITEITAWSADIPACSYLMTFVGGSSTGTEYKMLAVGVGKCLLTIPLDSEGSCIEQAFCSQAITSLCYSPEEDALFIGMDNGDIMTWKLVYHKKYIDPQPRSCQKPMLFKGHSDAISSIGYSAEGRLMFSSSMDSSVRLWDVANGNLLRCYRNGHRFGVVGTVMSRRTRLLLSAGVDTAISVWNLSSDDVLFKIKGHGAALSCISILQSENIVTADINGVVKIWNGDSFLCMQTLSLGSNISCICVLNDSVVAFREGKDVVIVEPDLSRSAKSELIYQVVLYNDIDYTILAAAQNVLQVWHMLTGKLEVHSTACEVPDIVSASFDQLKRKVVVGASDGQIAVYNSATLSCLQKHPKANGEILYISWLSSPQRIVSATASQIRILNQENDEIIYQQVFDEASKLGFACGSPDHKIMIWSHELELTVFDLNRCSVVTSKRAIGNDLSDLSISAIVVCQEIDVAVISFNQGKTCIYRLDKTGGLSLVGHLQTDCELSALGFSDTLRCIFAGFSSGHIARFDLGSVLEASPHRNVEKKSTDKNPKSSGVVISPCFKFKGNNYLPARTMCVIEPPVYCVLVTVLGQILIFNESGVELCEISDSRQTLWPIRLDVSSFKARRLKEAETVLAQVDGTLQKKISSYNPLFDPDCSEPICQIQQKPLPVKNVVPLKTNLPASTAFKTEKFIGRSQPTPVLKSCGDLISAEHRLAACLQTLSKRRFHQDSDLPRTRPYRRQ